MVKSLLTALIFLSPSLSFANTCFSYLSVEADLNDLEALDLIPISVDGKVSSSIDEDFNIDFVSKYKGQWLIVDLAAVWCSYCSLDQLYFSRQRNTPGDYTVVKNPWGDKVKMVSIYFEIAGKGAYDQGYDSIREFFLPENLKAHDYFKDADLSGVDAYLVLWQAQWTRLSTSIYTRRGDLFFPNMSGMPFQLIFNPEGKLVYSGNFTSAKDGEEWDKPYERQYQMIDQMIDKMDNKN